MSYLMFSFSPCSYLHVSSIAISTQALPECSTSGLAPRPLKMNKILGSRQPRVEGFVACMPPAASSPSGVA